MLESLECLLFCAFENQINCIKELNDSGKAIGELTETPNADNFNTVVSNQEVRQLYQMYCDLK